MPTRHGWATLVAGLAAFAVGRLFGLIELYVFGAALIGVLLSGLFSVHRRLPALRVRRVARPSIVSVGEPARVDVQVANTSHRRSPRLRLWEPVGDRGGAPMQLAPLAGGDAVTAAYRVPSSRRGLMRVGPLRAERTDALGLCSLTRVLAGSDEVLVVPERVPLPFPGIGSGGRLGEHLRMKSWGQSGSEFHSQREYVPGDDLRRINWKSSARTGGLIVRETAREGVRRCTIALDVSGPYDPDGFERAVTAAASLVAGAATADVATRLVSWGIDARGPDVAHEALRHLALVQPGEHRLELGGRTNSDGLGLVVVVTADSGTEAVKTARSALAPDDTLIVVSAMRPPGDDVSFGVDATSLDALTASWQQLVLGRVTV